MKARIILLGGMGFPATETAGGLPRFQQRLRQLGAEVLLISWKERQKAHDFLHGYVGKRALCGDSLGAGSAAQYAGDQEGPIDFVGGFQPSLYDARTNKSKKTIPVPINVIRAHCIYDPWFIDTAGLGYAKYEVPPKGKTILTITEHRGAHPDDWCYSQDLMLDDIKKHVGP